MSVEVCFNGKNEEINVNISILKLLENKDIRPEIVAVEVNDRIIEKEKYQDCIVKSGDKIEVLFYMGGGQVTKSALKNVLGLIGGTPVVKLNSIPQNNMAEIFAKLEYFNPGGSVKDRIALNMIADAESNGQLIEGTTIIEPTSGNTGIGIALICAVKKYKCILTMPEGMSLERLYILKSLGAEVVLTAAHEGMPGAIKKANLLNSKTKNSFMPHQFENPANPDMHYKTTGPEVWEQMGGEIDFFVAGIGTGGTITGAGRYLKEMNKEIYIVGIEPSGSAVLTKGVNGPHKIQGIGAGFVPKVLDIKIINEIITVDDDEAFSLSKRLASEEGIFVGISSGAALIAALKTAEKLGSDKRGLVVFPDTGERYFSMEQFFRG